MIHTDRGKNSQNRILNNVGGIQKPSHSCLQYHNIALFLSKIQEPQCCLYLKSRRLMQAFSYHFIANLFHLLHQSSKSFLCNATVSYLNSFPILKDCGRNISSHPIATALQNTCYIGRDRTLPVCSRHMDKFQVILRIAQPSAEFPDTVKSRNNPQTA